MALERLPSGILSGRRRFLVGSGAMVASISLIANDTELFGTMLQGVLRDNEPLIAAPASPEHLAQPPLPTFRQGVRDYTLKKPSWILNYDAAFTERLDAFAARSRESFEALQAQYVEGDARTRARCAANFAGKLASSALELDPGVSERAAWVVSQSKNSSSKVAFLNDLLAHAGHYMTFEPTTQGFYLDMWEIDGINVMEIALEAQTYSVPIIYLWRPVMYDQAEDLRGATALYDTEKDLVLLKENALEKEPRDLKFLLLASPQRGAFGSISKFVENFRNHLRRQVFRHEGTHAVFKRKFPKATLRSQDLEYVFSVQKRCSLRGRGFAINGNYTPRELDELAASGVQLSNAAHYGTYEVFTYLNANFPGYGLVKEYLVRALGRLPNLSRRQEKTLVSALSEGQSLPSEILEDVLVNPCLAPEVVEEIGKGMWALGFQAMEEMERQV